MSVFYQKRFIADEKPQWTKRLYCEGSYTLHVKPELE